ncbi:MAG: cupin domain-containing protein [Candidatus Dormibacteraeota bacterium]|nr:cupin domain-containing protein [Candidatus Dormibacteraeota bacterium]
MSIQQAARLLHQDEVLPREFAGGMLQWLVDQRLGAEHVMAYRLQVAPGDVASHAHDGSEEVLYVLEGTGAITVETAMHAVSAGKAVFIPAGAEHSYENTGVTPLVIVGAMAPPIDSGAIRATMPRLDLEGALRSAGIDERRIRPTMMDEERVTPTLMGERSFRVLVSPEVGCRQMTQFTGVIPTGRAPLHAHPHEEAVYILEGHGRLWIDEEPAGELRPGSVVFFPIGVRHTLENTGDADLKVLGTFSPAGSPEAKLPTPTA